MGNKQKNFTWVGWIFIVLVLGGFGWLCNHVEEDIKKLDWITNLFLGAVVVGLLFIIIKGMNK